MVKYFQSKPKVYTNSKTQCPCGGYYTDAVYSGVHANINPMKNHESSKMHQEYVLNGNKMSNKVKEKLDKIAAKEKAEKDEALAEKRSHQILCGCGSFYNNDYRGKEKHFDTAKHGKWALKNNNK